MGNNRLQALILVHVHKDILDNINLGDVANQFVDKKAANKHSDIFLRIIHNICKITLKLHLFISAIKCIKRGAV